MENWLPALLTVLSLSQIKAKPLESILPQDSEELQFQVQDCSGLTGDKLNIQSFNGGTAQALTIFGQIIIVTQLPPKLVVLLCCSLDQFATFPLFPLLSNFLPDKEYQRLAVRSST